MRETRPLCQGVITKRHLLDLAEKRRLPHASLSEDGDESCGGIEGRYAVANEIRTADESTWVSDDISSEANFRVNRHCTPLGLLGA
jgi:hypothetical protein